MKEERAGSYSRWCGPFLREGHLSRGLKAARREAQGSGGETSRVEGRAGVPPPSMYRNMFNTSLGQQQVRAEE